MFHLTSSPYCAGRSQLGSQHRSRSHLLVACRATALPTTEKKAVLIGVTGVTGRCAVDGLLSAGAKPEHLVVVTRKPSSEAALQLKQKGLQVVFGDLDEPTSLDSTLRGASFVYCHALSGDGASADPKEIPRGKLLAEVALASGRPHIIYNGSGGRSSSVAKSSNMTSKHQVADIFLNSGLPATSLEATLFMEELWKRFTRPKLLQGEFIFSVPSDVPIQLVAARDLGTATGTILKSPEGFAGRVIEMAGDELSPAQMCQAFGEAQGGMTVKQTCPPAWLFWLLNRDLYIITMFLKNRGYKGDVAACRQEFPGMLSFKEFLRATDWGNATRTYEQGLTFSQPSTASSRVPVS